MAFYEVRLTFQATRLSFNLLGGKDRANTESSGKDESTFDIAQPSKFVMSYFFTCGIWFYMMPLSFFLALLTSCKDCLAFTFKVLFAAYLC